MSIATVPIASHIYTAFHGIEEWVIRRALKILEGTGRAVVYPGATNDEDGVKFLATE